MIVSIQSPEDDTSMMSCGGGCGSSFCGTSFLCNSCPCPPPHPLVNYDGSCSSSMMMSHHHADTYYY